MITKAGRPKVTQPEDNYCTLNQKSLRQLPGKMLRMPVRAVRLKAAKSDTKDTSKISKSIMPRLVPG